MKMKMLLALGLCFALTFPLFAQEKSLLDSVYILPFAGCKIVLVGNGVTKLVKENNLEVLKNKFIEDYRASAKDKDFPAGAKSMIYLASQDGRRRLKALPDEDIQLDIENEIRSFKSDLPPFHYTIYDLMKAFEYHIYVSSPDNLEQLYTINYSTVFAQATTNNPTIKNYISIAITPTATSYNISRLNTNRKDYLILAPAFGISLINSSLSPQIGFDVNIQTQSKYGKPNLKYGVNYTYNMMADYQNKTFTNFNSLHSLNYHFSKNISNNKENFYLGVSLGKYYTDKIFGSARNGTLDKAWKFGIINQFKNFGIEYNFIYDKNKNRNAGITFKYYF